jgi:hypothetical protein
MTRDLRESDHSQSKKSPSKPATPDYFRKEPTTVISSIHEKETAKKFGRRVRGSGAVLGRPGDVSGRKDLQELKATDRTDETRIQLKWLQKIAFQALTQGKYPVCNMRFTKLKPPAPKDWVLIPAEVYKQLRGED